MYSYSIWRPSIRTPLSDSRLELWGGGREGGRGSSSWWYSTYIVYLVTRYHSCCSVLKYCHLFKTLEQMGVLEVWLGVLEGVCMCVVVVVVAGGWLGDLIS